MYVAEVKLTGFRSYQEAGVAFTPGLNIIVGENAAGRFCGVSASEREGEFAGEREQAPHEFVHPFLRKVARQRK